MVLISRLSLLISLLVLSVFFSSSFAQNAQVTVNQSEDIDALLKLKTEINKEAVNFKIQIYSGRSRVGATNSRKEYLENYSDWSTDMHFDYPNYKLWIGDFKTKIEADRALIRIKKTFPDAFITKPKKDEKD